MKINHFFIGLIFFCLVITSVASSQTTINGGRGLFRVFSAEVIGSADLYSNFFFSTFMKKEFKNSLTKDHTANLGLTFGFAKNFEAFLHVIAYQDDQESLWGPPGNTDLGVKYHLPFSFSNFHIGTHIFFTFPTAKTANVPFEQFSTDKTGWGGRLLFTLSFADMFPMVPFKLHGNFGYIDHSIDDQFFTSEVDQILLGLGAVFPIRSFQLYTEFTSESFMNQPEISFSSNSMRLTQGVKLIGPKEIIFDVVFDYGLSNKDSLNAIKKQKLKSPYIKDYFDWKFSIGATFRFSLHKYFDKSERKAKKRELEEQLKMNKIKKKRSKADKDLENMKKILEKKRSKKR